MSNIFGEDRETQIVGGGYGYGGGFGGSWCIIIIFFVIAWLLFRSDRHDGNYNNGGYNGMPYPYPPYGFNNCNSPLDCKIPMTPDMSNCEVDRDLWKVDANLLKCCCEEKEVTHMEAEATRALINANTMQELRDKLAEKACEVQALKTQQYTDAKFDGLYAKMACYEKGNDMQYYKLDNKIDALICETPKRPPIWCEGITPNTHHTDCDHRRDFRDDFPRRRRDCDFDRCCECN